MNEKEIIHLQDALEAAKATINEAELYGGGPIAVTIVGPNGQPIVTLAMDDVIGVSPRLSWRKAFTALMTGKDTIEWEQKEVDPQDFGGDKENISCFGGAVVLKGLYSRRIIGAVGVSGRRSHKEVQEKILQDHELALFCAEKLAEKMQKSK